MNVKQSVLTACAMLLSLRLLGCGCPYGTCRSSGEGDAASTGSVRPEEVAGIRQNLTDAVILVEGVEAREGEGYLLKGTVVSAYAVGGSAAFAEIGQTISLTPYFPKGSPDLSSAGHRRIMELSGATRGGRVRCRIALDGRGSWRIISAD